MGKIGRNAPCACGSGKKSKRCCGEVLLRSTARVVERPAGASEADMVAAFARRVYGQWLENPQRELGGLTPREAAKTEAGRARVGALIARMEADNARTIGITGNAPDPLDWLRDELGLAR